MTVGEKLSSLRILYDLSAPEVAEHVGMPVSVIYQLETDSQKAMENYWSILKRLCHFYNIPMAEIVDTTLSLPQIVNADSFLVDVEPLRTGGDLPIDDISPALARKDKLRLIMDRCDLSEQEIDNAAHLDNDATVEKLLACPERFDYGTYAHSYYRIAKALSVPIDFFDIRKENAILFCETDSTYTYKSTSKDHNTITMDNEITSEALESIESLETSTVTEPDAPAEEDASSNPVQNEEIVEDIEPSTPSTPPASTTTTTTTTTAQPASSSRPLPEGFDKMTPAQRLKALRQSMNMSVAEVCAQTGNKFSASVINNIERGRTKITPERVEILARLYEVVPKLISEAPESATPPSTPTSRTKRTTTKRAKKAPIETPPTTPAKAPTASPIRSLIRRLNRVFDLVDELSTRSDYSYDDMNELRKTLEAMKNERSNSAE